MWLLYEILLVVGFLLYLPGALARRRLPHAGWRMRLGRYRPELTQRLGGRPTIWMHAVSVGEVLACRPLVQALTQAAPTHPVVLSTITPSGFGVASSPVGGRVVPIYCPLDLRVCVRRALATLQPRLLILVESEFWPVLMHLTASRGTPIVVVNGRVSTRAFRRYAWVRRWMRPCLAHVSRFLMQSEADADRIMALGAVADRVTVAGSLKWDASLGSRPSPEALRATAGRIGLLDGERLIVAGSTHRGEEQAVLQGFQAVRQARPPVRLIIAPRHLERLSEVEDEVERQGLRPGRLSQVAADRPWDVGLVDTFGQLPQYYGLATVAFVGGSLIPHGGQNPLEPASLGKPVLFGPSMQNFAEIAHELIAHRAARQVADPAALAAALRELLAAASAGQEMGRRAQELTEARRGTTHRLLDALKPFLTASAPST